MFGLFRLFRKPVPVPESARRLYALNGSPHVAVIGTKRVKALKSRPASLCFNSTSTPSNVCVAPDLYNNLQPIQPATACCDVGALLVCGGLTYDILRSLPGIDSSIECSTKMGEALVEQRYVLTLSQFEELSFTRAFWEFMRQPRFSRERIDRYVCFVQTTDSKQPVAAMCLWSNSSGRPVTHYVDRHNLKGFYLRQRDALLIPNPVV